MPATSSTFSSPADSSRGKLFRVHAALQELHERYRGVQDGAVATYIPELAKANPDWFGICVVTADGQRIEIGDVEQQFSIQSISKPFVYGLALEDHGREAVLGKVGVEPTGDTFNSIIQLDAANRPHNPCVNAGAIATTSLIKGENPAARLGRVLDLFAKYFGRRVQVDMAAFMSERMTGHRNRAIAYLMLNFGMIGSDVDQILDLYFQQCSILGNCRDLATMAATLANGGVNPITLERAVDSQYLRDMLTVMYTCGMYDFAGQWGYSVGLPAKSGVSGAIIAVVPNQLGIAVYSPRLDERGNSVRAIRVCQDLSREFGMHMFDSVLTRGTNATHEAETSANRVIQRPTPPAHRGDHINATLTQLHDALKHVREGHVATYIPELARVNPDLLAISVVTCAGDVFAVGDTDVDFTLQSLANPFSYGAALDRAGRAQVEQAVGVEPTGNPFHAIVLERGTNRPMNPLVNAGAIAIAGLLPGDDPADKLNRALDGLGLYIGSRPSVDMSVYLSERTTADRNRAIAYLMRNFGRLRGDLEETLDLYFQMCSTRVNTTQLATMAATLASGGVNPITRQRAITPVSLRDVLSVMFTCGLYEQSGLWAYKVGIPAKSGVSGGFMAVVPGVLGVGVYSPRLNEGGNSVRGIKACESLASMLDLGVFRSA